MKGLAPLDQEARNSKSTCLLPQGTEMVDAGSPLAGAGTRWEACRACSQKGLCLTAPWWGEASRVIRGSRRGGTPRHPGTRDPSAPPNHPPSPDSSPQNLGRATPAEATFTFLCEAWGCVQSPGSTEPRIVVMGWAQLTRSSSVQS